MKTADVIGLVLIPAALFLAAWLMNTVGLASAVLEATLPWICTMIGIVLLILAATCLILGRMPGQLPVTAALVVCVVTSLGLLLGLAVDVHYHYPEARRGEVLIEWLGFTAILCTIFFVPRVRSRPASGPAG